MCFSQHPKCWLLVFWHTSSNSPHLTRPTGLLLTKATCTTTNTTTTDQDSDGISASYTMGGITVAGAMNSTENIAGDTNTTADKDAYEMSISFAF